MVDSKGNIRPDCFGYHQNHIEKCLKCECIDECVSEQGIREDIQKKIDESGVEPEDMVNSPSHYRQHKFESIDEMIIVFGEEAVYYFCICNAWKYRNRAPYKGKQEEDNKKADWYLTKAKELKEVLNEKNKQR